MSTRIRVGRTRGAVVLGRLVLLILIMVAWQLVVVFGSRWDDLLGSPFGVAAQLAEWLGGLLLGATLSTVVTGVAGLALGVTTAVVLVAITWPSHAVRRFLSPFLALANALPKIALAPLFIVWFGIGAEMAIAFVSTIVFFMVYLNLFSGLSSTDRLLVDNARSQGASNVWVLRAVYAPAVMTWLLATLRGAAIWALVGAALAQFLAGSEGLGLLLKTGMLASDADAVVAAGVVLGLLSWGSEAGLARLERRWLAWRSPS